MQNAFINNILSDLKVELKEAFDLNFEKKSFFGSPWPTSLIPNRRGSLMARSGALRRSIRAHATPAAGTITFTSSMPYAAINNDGGTIVVTAKMKRYFWARYYELTGKVTYNVKTKSANYNAKTKKLTGEAAYWRAMALKKVGSKLTIRQRQFIGHHAQVDAIVEQVADRNFKALATQLKTILKPKP